MLTVTEVMDSAIASGLTRAKVYVLGSIYHLVAVTERDERWCRKQVNKMKRKQIIAAIQQNSHHRKEIAKRNLTFA